MSSPTASGLISSRRCAHRRRAQTRPDRAEARRAAEARRVELESAGRVTGEALRGDVADREDGAAGEHVRDRLAAVEHRQQSVDAWQQEQKAAWGRNSGSLEKRGLARKLHLGAQAA